MASAQGFDTVLGGIIGAAVGGIVDIATLGAATPFFNPVYGFAAGAEIGNTVYTTQQTQQKAAADVANLGTGTYTQPTATTPTGTTPAGTPSGGGVAAPGASTYDETTYANEKYAESMAQVGEMEESGGAQILGLQTQETMTEGSIRASAAARGLKLEGSPLMQLIAQQSNAQQSVGLAERQLAASAAGAGNEATTNLNNALAGIRAGVSDINYYANQDISNAWLSAFTSTIDFASNETKNVTADQWTALEGI